MYHRLLDAFGHDKAGLGGCEKEEQLFILERDTHRGAEVGLTTIWKGQQSVYRTRGADSRYNEESSGPCLHIDGSSPRSLPTV